MRENKFLKEKAVRCIWVETERKWYFSVVDVCGILYETSIPHVYWCDLKRKLKDSRLYEKTTQLEFQFSENQTRRAETLDTEGILRLMRIIRTPRAALFKIWLITIRKNLKKYTEAYNDSAKICVRFSMRKFAS